MNNIHCILDKSRPLVNWYALVAGVLVNVHKDLIGQPQNPMNVTVSS